LIDSALNYSSFYHLHIAKCGGTYLTNTLLHTLRDELIKKNISYLDGSHHLGWQEANNNYVISSLRDPVKRTVSHYSYWKVGGGVGGRKPENPLSFLEWVEEHRDFISNYQVKNLLFTRTNFNYDIFQPKGSLDPSFLSLRINKAVLLERISRVNILLKDTQLNIACLTKVSSKIRSDFGITTPLETCLESGSNNKVLKDSAELYQSLGNTDKQYLYELNEIDSEIYFSSAFYFEKGLC
jgi:hypothetical protein